MESDLKVLRVSLSTTGPLPYHHFWLTSCTSCFHQGGQWLSWCHAARLGHRDGSVFTRPHGPRGRSALRPVRRPAGGQRCLRLHGESVGSWDGDLPPHTAGPHQQSVFITGEQWVNLNVYFNLHKTRMYVKVALPDVLCTTVWWERTVADVITPWEQTVYDAARLVFLRG